LSANESDELAVLHNSFNLVISADNQMSKLVPNWGQSPQPGSTYYLQKLSHYVFGIVNHATNKMTIYLLDEWFLRIQTIPYPMQPTLSLSSLIGYVEL